MKITITNDLPNGTWGFPDLLADMPNATEDEKIAAIINLLLEDTAEVLDGATWSVDLETV